MSDLHQIEIELLLIAADFAEQHDRPISWDSLFAESRLEYAHFVRRLWHLSRLGLVRIERERPLAESSRRVTLTGKGTLYVVAERAAARPIVAPGARSRLSALADDGMPPLIP